MDTHMARVLYWPYMDDPLMINDVVKLTKVVDVCASRLFTIDQIKIDTIWADVQAFKKLDDEQTIKVDFRINLHANEHDIVDGVAANIDGELLKLMKNGCH